MPPISNIQFRDDFKFMYELSKSFNFYRENNRFPKIRFRTLPSLCNARWNSRAIYALLAYFLLPHWRKQLMVPCIFISGVWSKAWFSSHVYDSCIYEILHSSLKEINCPKALNSFEKHWKNEPSVISNIKRTNIFAERAVKVMETIVDQSKTPTYLTAKFIVKNEL